MTPPDAPAPDVDALIARLNENAAEWRASDYEETASVFDEAAAALAAQAQRIAELERENGAYKKECALLTHKIITCGVAASHPDSTLSLREKDYARWDSPQAQEVRKVRDRAETAEAALRQAVPREPTAAMFIAGTKALAEADGSFARLVWYAMYDAAPAAPKGGT